MGHREGSSCLGPTSQVSNGLSCLGVPRAIGTSLQGILLSWAIEPSLQGSVCLGPSWGHLACLCSWLAGRRAGWLAGWLAGCQTGWLAGWLAFCQPFRCDDLTTSLPKKCKGNLRTQSLGRDLGSSQKGGQLEVKIFALFRRTRPCRQRKHLHSSAAVPRLLRSSILFSSSSSEHCFD
jgi:hypothetical protein